MKRPVFVLGSPRSGTTLLYHMLLSSGGFVVYRAESNVFNILGPRFGNLATPRDREALLNAWLASKLFRVSGLDAKSVSDKILNQCASAADFLRVLMQEMALAQGVDRWAECTPDHLLYLPQIKKSFPDALIVHVIRDGRDVALSLDRLRWIRPFPWQKQQSRLVASLYWEWIVRKGRGYGTQLGPDYTEVRFEELAVHPQLVLTRLGKFLQHELNYERIREVAIGSVREPNTSFSSEVAAGEFNPVGRWRERFIGEELSKIEGLVGDLLCELSYTLTTNGIGSSHRAALKRMRATYLSYFETKLWLKKNTPLGKFFINSDLSWT